MRLPSLLALVVLTFPVLAAEAAEPEIDRPAAAPQAVGAVHTLRAIPEACARLEGAFTGHANAPYRFATVRISPACQARARFVDATKAEPSAAAGWVVNDVIRVPSAGCAAQQAVVTVWRKPGQAHAPELDAQGRARIYLGDAKQQTHAGRLAAVDMFAAQMAVEGEPCR